MGSRLRAALAALTSPAAKPKIPPQDPRRRFFGMLRGLRKGLDHNISHENAFTISAFWACVDVISKDIATSPKRIFEYLEANDYELRPDDPLHYILNTRPNPDSTAVSLWRAMVAHALTWGNGYSEIVRDRAGRVVALWLISPDRVTIRRSEAGVLYYEVDLESMGKRNLDAGDVFHVRGPGLTSYAGDDNVARMINTLALATSAQDFAGGYYDNGSTFAGYLEVDGELDEKDEEELRRRWRQAQSGPKSAWDTPLLSGGVKFTPVTMPKAADAQLIEARQFEVEEICRFFGVPPHKIQSLGRATWGNIEHLGLEYTRHTLRPWAMEIQQEAEAKLFSQRKPWRFLRVDTTWAAKGDFKTRVDGYRGMREMGVFSVNDILREEEANTIGKEGDIRIVNGAYIPLKDVGKPKTPPPPPPGVEAPPPGEEPEEEEEEEAPNQETALLEQVVRRELERHNRRVSNERERRHEDPERFEAWLVEKARPAALADGRAVLSVIAARGYDATAEWLEACRSVEQSTRYMDATVRSMVELAHPRGAR